MYHMLKAVKRIEELIEVRRSTTNEDEINEYSIIEAGFLYQQGNILVTYIESKSDVFGNIPALDVPESESESEEADESEAPEKQEEAANDEPKIEDETEVAARKKQESLEEEKVPQQQADQKDDPEANQKEEENASNTLVEDATENILAAI